MPLIVNGKKVEPPWPLNDARDPQNPGDEALAIAGDWALEQRGLEFGAAVCRAGMNVLNVLASSSYHDAEDNLGVIYSFVRVMELFIGTPITADYDSNAGLWEIALGEGLNTVTSSVHAIPGIRTAVNSHLGIPAPEEPEERAWNYEVGNVVGFVGNTTLRGVVRNLGGGPQGDEIFVEWDDGEWRWHHPNQLYNTVLEEGPPEPLITPEDLEAAIDESLPPGTMRVDGQIVRRCKACGGEGTQESTTGIWPCPPCAGRGWTLVYQCDRCRDSGMVDAGVGGVAIACHCGRGVRLPHPPPKMITCPNCGESKQVMWTDPDRTDAPCRQPYIWCGGGPVFFKECGVYGCTTLVPEAQYCCNECAHIQ
jgi:predicted RNA-binding Zn-ribbon protein involved in translation (DUF1610 family)